MTQLILWDSVATGGRRLREDHPRGMPDRAWWLSRKYVNAGVPAADAQRLAASFRWREMRARLFEAPATLWDPPRRIEREMSRPLEAPDRIRVLFRPDCSPEIRKRIQAGQYHGVEWVDGLGGVLVGAGNIVFCHRQGKPRHGEAKITGSRSSPAPSRS